MGKEVGPRITDPFVQMFPYFDKNGAPPSYQAFMSQSVERIKQKRYQRDPDTGLFNFSAASAENQQPLVAFTQEMPFIMRLGVVRKREGVIPSQSEIDRALLSHMDYRLLMSRSPVTLEICPKVYPYSPV